MIEVVTAPAFEPVSRAEAKRWLRIGAAVTEHDPVIDLLIKAAREEAENRTFRAFITRTLRLTLPCWPADSVWGAKIVLPRPPLQSVTSIQYRDTNGALQTLAADQYDVYEGYEPGCIVPAYGVSWPSLRLTPDSVQVNYTAGYAPGSPSDEASNQESMPAALRLWMQAKLATLFEQREQIVMGLSVAALPSDFTDRLLDPLVVGTRMF
jgi:uncharacterized phiE125 gp8 family phage protein